MLCPQLIVVHMTQLTAPPLILLPGLQSSLTGWRGPRCLLGRVEDDKDPHVTSVPRTWGQEAWS